VASGVLVRRHCLGALGEVMTDSGNEICVKHKSLWDDAEGLAEAHVRTTSSTDGRRREGAEERLLARLGMSEYYGSERGL